MQFQIIGRSISLPKEFAMSKYLREVVGCDQVRCVAKLRLKISKAGEVSIIPASFPQ